MGALSVVLLVAFVIICVLLVLLVLVQDQDNSGMGSMLGGGNSAAFGSHSANVLTKATIVLTVLFFAATFSIALLNKKTTVNDNLAAVAAENGISATNVDTNESAEWWKTSESTGSSETTVEAASEN